MSDTVGDWLRTAQQPTGGAVTPERLDCELLLCEILGKSRSFIIAHPEHTLAPAAQDRLNAALTALRAGQPLAYILGEREFWGLTLHVDPAVLIPRPETELLVELTLQRLPAGATCLDLGTGSGAIAIAIASERPDVQVTATDASRAALAVAQRNAARHDTPVEFIESDWFGRLGKRRWDAILSNPPYVAPDDPHLPALAHEPAAALVAQDSGLRDLHHIIAGAPAHLADGGTLMLEHGFDQAGAVRARFETGAWHEVQTHRDLGGHERVTCARYPGLANTE